jgi:hypothetical protein
MHEHTTSAVTEQPPSTAIVCVLALQELHGVQLAAFASAKETPGSHA